MWKQQGGEPNADDVGVIPRLMCFYILSENYKRFSFLQP